MEKKLAIVGLGYVGLPLALTYALQGFTVAGVDVDASRITSIRSASLGMREDFDGTPVNDVLRVCLADGRLTVVNRFADLPRDISAYIVTVGIPIDDQWHLNMSMLTSACVDLGKLLKKGDIVICRSTVPVGTTRGLVCRTLEHESGLSVGKDFGLAYSSERIAEGRAYDEFRHMPLVVGAMDSSSLERAIEVLGAINTRPIFRASSIEVVEAAKMFENAQRDVNIAIADQMARFANRLGIPTQELIDACNTHTRVKILAPGIGVGGHCIPYASPYLFGSLAGDEECERLLPTFVSARNANAAQPAYIVERMSSILHGIDGRHILLLGIGMKDYSDDVTVSPSIDVARELAQRGAAVHVMDAVANSPQEFVLESDIDQACAWADAVVIPILQHGIDYDRLKGLVLSAGGRIVLFDFRSVYGGDAEICEEPWYIGL